MTAERWAAVDAVLQLALDRTPADRSAFLAQACAGDAELRREVESLLAAGRGADDFLERPAFDEVDATSTLARLSTALAGRYTLEREVGRGGMATVYLARDLRHKRHVALKVLHQALGTLVGPSRFRREIETVAGLSHPHILPLHDSGGDLADSSGGRSLYYVMPYVAGGSLRDRLQRERRLAVVDALRIVREVATALDYAHRHGVVHRDIKPENILLSEGGEALVADFGIARALQRATALETPSEATGVGVVLPHECPETLSQWGAVAGTPAYMSPEQALGRKDIDGRSDQYALACVAFEMLTGERPFTGSAVEQVKQRPTQKPPSLATRRPDLSTTADAVLVRALAPDREARFSSATAMAEALGDALPVARDAVGAGIDRAVRAPIAGRRVRRSAIGLAALATVAVMGPIVFRAQRIDVPRGRQSAPPPVAAAEAPGRVSSASGATGDSVDPARVQGGGIVDPGAFDLYVRGVRVRSRSPEGSSPAEYFVAAIARDSTFAPAYAALAFERTFAGNGAEARGLVNKALALDPKLAEAHMALGMIREFRDRDWAGSEAAFRQAIRLNEGFAEAHHELSMLLMRRRRFDEALGEARTALYLAPMTARLEVGMGEVYLYSGRYDEAIRSADRALTIEARNGGPHMLKAYVHAERQSYATAAAAAQKAIAFGFGVHGRALLGYIHARSGRRGQARSIIDTLQQQWRQTSGDLTSPDLAIGIAQVYVGLQEPERALDWLERSVGREMYASYLGIDPTFRSLRAEPRFRAILKRLGLAA